MAAAIVFELAAELARQVRDFDRVLSIARQRGHLVPTMRKAAAILWPATQVPLAGLDQLPRVRSGGTSRVGPRPRPSPKSRREARPGPPLNLHYHRRDGSFGRSTKKSKELDH